MEDPYRDRKADFEKMARACEDMAKATKNLEATANAVMWGLVAIVVSIAAIVGLNIWLMP